MIRRGAAVAAASAALLAFLFLALEPTDGKEATFAAVFACLLASAAAGPFLTARAAAVFAAGPPLVCGVVAVAHGGPVGAALLCGLFCAAYAGTLAAWAHALRGGVAAVALGVLGIALLFTLHVWDDCFLPRTTSQTGSAAVAFGLNPAAAASVALDFDWVHAKALYTNNQTAEAMFGVPRQGLGGYALRLGGLAVAAIGLAHLRRRHS